MRKQLVFMLVSVSGCQRSPAPEAGESKAAAATAAPATSSSGVPSAPKTVVTTFSFDADAAGSPPNGFVFGRTGDGRAADWVVRVDGAAPSRPNVLAQLDADPTSFRFPLAVTAQAQPANVVVSVRCKMISGRVDQACGLVLRYRDEDNYLVTRANALEDNVRLYTVEDGKRDEIASHDVEMTPNVWHDYRFEARGEEHRVWWDGQLVLEHRHQTFVGAGSVGVWTKADSVTYFDDLTVEPL